MDNSKELKTISLCTGYGGLELGIELLGEQRIRHILICEIEAFAIATNLEKMQKGQMVSCPMWTNLKTLCAKPFRGHTDLLTAGFPCQPFSKAGRYKADQDERHLFPDILRIIDECRPTRVFFENVEGLIATKLQTGESALKYVLRSLGERGYRTAWTISSAIEAGAKHQRKRVFILGNLSDT